MGRLPLLLALRCKPVTRMSRAFVKEAENDTAELRRPADIASPQFRDRSGACGHRGWVSAVSRQRTVPRLTKATGKPP